MGSNIIPVMKKGGYLVFTIRQDFYESSDFEKKMNAYLKNQIVLVEKSDLYQAFKSSPVLHHIEVYQAIWALKMDSFRISSKVFTNYYLY